MLRAILLLALLAATPTGASEILALWDSAYVSARPGVTVRLLVQADIRPGHVIIANQARADGFAPLTLTFDKSRYLTPGRPSFPIAQQAAVEDGARQVPAYATTVRIMVPVTISAQAPTGEAVLAGTLRYQACDPKHCRPAGTLPVRLVIDID